MLQSLRGSVLKARSNPWRVRGSRLPARKQKNRKRRRRGGVRAALRVRLAQGIAFCVRAQKGTGSAIHFCVFRVWHDSRWPFGRSFRRVGALRGKPAGRF